MKLLRGGVINMRVTRCLILRGREMARSLNGGHGQPHRADEASQKIVNNRSSAKSIFRRAPVPWRAEINKRINQVAGEATNKLRAWGNFIAEGVTRGVSIMKARRQIVSAGGDE